MAEGPKRGEGRSARGGETGDPVAAGSPRGVVALSLVSSVDQPAVIVEETSAPAAGGRISAGVRDLREDVSDPPGSRVQSTVLRGQVHGICPGRERRESEE